jgi:hypothetical protein
MIVILITNFILILSVTFIICLCMHVDEVQIHESHEECCCDCSTGFNVIAHPLCVSPSRFFTFTSRCRYAGSLVRPGVSTDDIDKAVHSCAPGTSRTLISPFHLMQHNTGIS